MARCAGCAGSGTCNCLITAGTGITVTGDGNLGTEYVISATGGGGSGGPPVEGTYYVASNTARPEIKAMADFVCDGVADDVQIQAAIDAAAAHLSGAVVLSEGTFNLATTVTITNDTTHHITLRGVGIGGGDYDGPIPSTIIARPVAMLIPSITVTNTVQNNVSFSNIYFQDTVNTTDKNAMLSFLTNYTVVIDSCYFHTLTSTFPYPRARAIEGQAQLKLRNSSFSQIPGACIVLTAMYQTMITNNYFYTQISNGGAFGANEYCLIITGSAPAGDDDDWPVIVSNNFSDGNARGTVQFIGVANALIANNVFLFDNEATVLLDQCAEVQVNSNQFGGTDAEVVQVSNSLYIQVNDNQIHRPGTHGVLLTGSNDCQVNNNHILTGSAAGSAGVMIDADSNTNMVTGNMIRGTFTYGIRVNNANCNDNLVTNNDLKNSGTTPFSDIGTGTAITAGNRLV